MYSEQLPGLDLHFPKYIQCSEMHNPRFGNPSSHKLPPPPSPNPPPLPKTPRRFPQYYAPLYIPMLGGRVLNRGRELNTSLFFSNFSGAPGISRPNPGISRPKSLISLDSRGIPNFLAPTPSCGRPLPHRKISGLRSLGLCSFFAPDLRGSGGGGLDQ